jgi:hypothetical protein
LTFEEEADNPRVRRMPERRGEVEKQQDPVAVAVVQIDKLEPSRL